MEISPANTEGRAAMSDVMLARNLIREIAGDAWNGKADMLACVHQSCISAGMKITPRRIRAIWHREAAGVRYHEMVGLADVAAAEKASRTRIEEARSSHADFIRRANDLLERLAVQDAEFHGEYAAALRALAVGQAGSTVQGCAGALGASSADRGTDGGRAGAGGSH